MKPKIVTSLNRYIAESPPALSDSTIQRFNDSTNAHDPVLPPTLPRSRAVPRSVAGHRVVSRAMDRARAATGLLDGLGVVRRDTRADVLQRAKKTSLPPAAFVRDVAANSHLRGPDHRRAVRRPHQLSLAKRLVRGHARDALRAGHVERIRWPV